MNNGKPKHLKQIKIISQNSATVVSTVWLLSRATSDDGSTHTGVVGTVTGLDFGFFLGHATDFVAVANRFDEDDPVNFLKTSESAVSKPPGDIEEALGDGFDDFPFGVDLTFGLGVGAGVLPFERLPVVVADAAPAAQESFSICTVLAMV